jgi:hypothetical protein
MTTKTLIAQLVLISATLYAGFAGAEGKVAEGKVIARKDLPQAMTAKTTKAPKFPGIPACAKGRLQTDVWPAGSEQKGHKCADAQTLYVCAAFGKLSIKCED